MSFESAVWKNWRPENECGDAFKETLEGLVNVEGRPESKYHEKQGLFFPRGLIDLG